MVIPSADPTLLRTGQYADSTNLNARSAIYRFRRPDFDLHGFISDLVPTVGRVLDAGCGPGSYLQRFAASSRSDVVGVDVSHGMAVEASRHAPTGAADITALPFADDTFDTALAMHMLYHVDPPAAGVAELRRVVRSGGTMLAVTNGARHLAGLDALILDATGLDHWGRSMHRFSLENGESQLAEHFDRIEVREVEGELVVPDADVVMNYVASIEDFVADQVSMPWIDAMNAMRPMVDQEIAETGAWRSTVHSGVFICR